MFIHLWWGNQKNYQIVPTSWQNLSKAGHGSGTVCSGKRQQAVEMQYTYHSAIGVAPETRNRTYIVYNVATLPMK